MTEQCDRMVVHQFELKHATDFLTQKKRRYFDICLYNYNKFQTIVYFVIDIVFFFFIEINATLFCPKFSPNMNNSSFAKNVNV